jgi:hypothetical protein
MRPGPRIGVIGGLFLAALTLQWGGLQSVATADGIAYIIGGVNLVRTGHFTSPFGTPEDWFPPIYPLLIGVLSLGGRIDPMLVGRLISAVNGLATVVLVWWCLRTHPAPAAAPAIAAIALAGNASHQLLSSSTMSNATATMLAFAAFVTWLGGHETAGVARSGLLGLLAGLSYLVRPEAVVLLPLWAIADGYSLGIKAFVKRYAVACTVTAAVMLPYIVYLHEVTGRWTISNKSEVNLVGGRAAYYGGPRDYINPDSLEMGYYRYDVTPRAEALRYLHNWRLIGQAYAAIYRPPVGGGLLLCAAVGAADLLARRRWRLLWGLLVQFAYLPVLAYYVVSPGYLHATLPALSVLIGFGLANLVGLALSAGAHRAARLAAGVVVLWGLLGLTESWTRYPRWGLTAPPPAKGLLREAGLRFAAKGLPGGFMYESGATVGYYAGLRRGRIPEANDLATLVRYIRSHHRGPVYMALTTQERYPPSLEELLRSDAPPFDVVLALEDRRGRVVVYRVQ